MINIDRVELIKLYNVDREFSDLLERFIIGYGSINIFERPEIQIQAEPEKASIVFKFKIYIFGRIVDYINIPVFIFRHTGSIQIRSYPASKDQKHSIKIDDPFIEYRCTMNTCYYFPIDDLLFVNKYIFGVYWKDYLDDGNIE